MSEGNPTPSASPPESPSRKSAALSRLKIRKRRQLTQREDAEHYLFLTLLSFAASVSLTRLFLASTGYPQIGGGELHIAHVLWGGLLLYAGALFPLLFANRRAYTLSALLVGAGMGLFIDEVGKFITASNDYFFAPAASIIYITFLISIVVFLQVRRIRRSRARDALMHVFEDLWEALDGGLTPREYRRLKGRLGKAAGVAPSEKHSHLAETLLAFLDSATAPEEMLDDTDERMPGPLQQAVTRLFSPDVLRGILVAGLIGIGLLSLKNPVSAAAWVPVGLREWLAGMHLGRHVEAVAAPTWSALRMMLEWVVGLGMLAAAGLLIAKRDRLGSALGSVALLLSLTTVSVLLFYFEQFSTVITTSIQFILLTALGFYRERLA